MPKQILYFLTAAILLFTPLFAEMTIEIIEPADGAYYTPCQDIPIRVRVTTTGETVRYVYFYTNGVSRGRATEEPWETTRWTEVSTGNYVIEAKVLDADRNEVWSEPIKIKVGAVSSADLISNGDFTCGKNTGWTLNIYEEGNGSMTLMDDGYFDDAYYMMYESERASTDWYVQFSQTVPVDSGHFYDIYFLADSDEPRPLTVGFQEPREPYRTHVWQTIQIDGADEYRLEGGMAMFSDAQNIFKFNLGGSAVPLYLDNIRVIDRSMALVKSKELSLAGGINEYELHQAHPNPFNMHTTIRFVLSQAAHIQVDIYNMQGQKVVTLISGEHAAGTHMVRWNGLDDSGAVIPSGVYLYRLTGPDAPLDLSRKLLLLK